MKVESTREQLTALSRRDLEVAIVVTCGECDWRYYVVTFHCFGWENPRPGKCERCGAERSRRWVTARMFLHGEKL